MSQLKTCIFIGRSGCGKGTQAKRLIEKLESLPGQAPVVYIETGRVFREFITGTAYTHQLAREIIETGGRQPDFLAIWNWAGTLIKETTGQEHIIFDGAPRSPLEAQVVDTAMRYYQRQNPAIVYLNVGKEWAFARLKGRGRHDDDDAKINNRLAWFDRDVLPTLEYYKHNAAYRFLDINGEQDMDLVSKDIWRALGLNDN